MSTIITFSNCPACGSSAIGKVMACKDYTVSDEIFEVWECMDCTIRFTQNIPDLNNIGPYYQSDTYISHSDTEKGLVNKMYKIARSYTLNWKMNLVKTSLEENLVKGKILDIGAGTGAFLHKAFDSGWSVTGIEPDEGARKICKDKYGIQVDGPEKLFDFPGEQYDAITLWHVLEHVHQLHEYMDQVKRLLKQEGVALIALPNYMSADAVHYKEYWAAYDVPRHLYHFSPPALRQLVNQHGLQLDSIKPMWLDAFYIAMLSEGYKNRKGNFGAAVVNGFQSNLRAIKHKEKCSSLVYIVRHKK